ncbi:site-specific integrase [Peribacillus saganii]|uniref:Site-specific integrase n=1 Tax=Peribacillus saganii TaxID=2303992 RepID=A0A372LL14_9BACI|nr:site-specific integrase [Peribacillus saganii]RFU67473.1 site-specific integrase [Peribacillus saganii]
MSIIKKKSKQSEVESQLQELLKVNDLETILKAARSVFNLTTNPEGVKETRVNNLTLEDAVNKFYSSAKFMNYTVSTQESYKYEIKQLLSFLSSKGLNRSLLFENIIYPTQTLVEYINSYCKKSTRNKKAAFLRAFIKTTTSEFYDNNKEDFQTSLKIDWDSNDLPKFYTKEQIKELLVLSKYTSNGLRNYTILCVFIGTALRISELVGIQIADIDIENEMVMVRRKRNKGVKKPAYIQRDSFEILLRYINFIYGHLDEDWKRLKEKHGDLFVFSGLNQGTHITERAVRDMIKSLVKQASSISEEEAERLSVHNFRHSFAVHGIRSGINIFAMMDLMGHKTINALQQYTKQTNDQLKEDIERHPLSKVVIDIKQKGEYKK